MSRKEEHAAESAEQPKEESALLDVVALAAKHGQKQKISVKEDAPFSADHLCAAALNGWNRFFTINHEHFKTTDAVYLAALAAAKEKGKAHAPAIAVAK